MTTTHAIDPRLNATYHNVFKELAKDRYRTYSVAEFYCDGNKIPDPNKVNVIVRIDVDFGFHLSVPLAKALAHYGINSTHYFLTHPERYYNPWGSGIPAQIHQLGQEVGLHSDHYYGQLVDGDDGLSRLKADVTRLSAETGAPIRGMVYHGHTKIDAMKKTNWELTRNLDSAELGLEYHDNLNGVYIKPGATFWQPDCDIRVSDWLGFSNSWGWNYMPSYPLRFLRQAQPGQIVHLAFHTHNAFEYWRNWSYEYGEPFKAKESALTFWRKAVAIRRRQQLRPKERMIALTSNLLGLLGAQLLGRLWKRPKQSEPDTSWETARQRIFDRGINYWHGILADFDVLAPGGRVLEVGSGNGQWLLAFAQDAEAVFGIEPGQAIREYSQQKILEFPEQMSRITISPGAAENIRYPSESMDCVLCMEVFMFTKQEQALRELEQAKGRQGP
ncbi:MAG: class I SAM-dependent methyltransferase, partial [Pseudomonadales bacterium]|nr:class I SAM-dependent methyltransferase [Pseudomonadales bacterium]